MKNNRRDFLKLTSLAGAGMVGTSFLAGSQDAKNGSKGHDEVVRLAGRSCKQEFNMCRYGADPIPTVRIGIVGLGNRGPSAVRRISYLDGVDIKAYGRFLENQRTGRQIP